MSKVRVALIGCGNISRAHLNGYMACPDAEVAYCVDTDEAMAREKADAINAEAHTDYLEVLDHVDAVDICVPHHLHAQMTVEAARRGKHVLTEKPMARTLPEARWMIDEVEKAGVVFMVAFVLRYRPEFQMFHDVCHDGRIGKVLHGYMQTQQMLSRINDWRRDPYTFPMGAYLSHGCHYVDLLQWCIGPIKETANVSHALTLGDVIPGGDDTNCAIFRHENGAVSGFADSWATPYPTHGIRFEAYGAKGSIRLTYDADKRRAVDLIDAKGVQRLYELDPNDTEAMDVFGGVKDMEGQIDHFISAIVEGKQPTTHGREGIKAMQVILASTAAEREGRTIEVAEFVRRPENTNPWSEPDFRVSIEREYGHTSLLTS